MQIIRDKLFLFTLLAVLWTCAENQDQNKGLIGIYYSEPNLTSIKALTVLESLDQTWDEKVDFQGESSGEWNGYIKAPIDGQVTFYLATDQTAEVHIAQNSMKANRESPLQTLKIDMTRGQSYPLTLLFWHTGGKGDPGSFSLKWSWPGQEIQSIAADDMYYTEKESSKLQFLKEIDPASIDKSQFIYPQVENVIVYHETGRFAAWPANNGIWSWGDEILVGFLQGYNKENKYHHAVDYNKPMRRAFARSVDGGYTWDYGRPPDSFQSGSGAKPFEGSINYAAEGFALKNRDDFFYFSYDKGHNWQGPFLYPDLGIGKMTSRTDYIVNSSGVCFIFGSVKDDRVRAALQDRALCFKTADAGRTFQFVGWMSEQDTIRSVMPATVRINDNHLVSAMRRRLDPPKNDKYGLARNWIDVYHSRDNGQSWYFLSKIANTDRGIRNGNPPSMVRLESGLLCVVYGFRGVPYSIRSRISRDNGKTWSKEIILRDDARIWDIGYTRSVVRSDGKIVSVYYFSTEQNSERHIAATIWDPRDINF